jgi:hypothetical protein
MYLLAIIEINDHLILLEAGEAEDSRDWRRNRDRRLMQGLWHVFRRGFEVKDGILSLHGGPRESFAPQRGAFGID